MVIAECNKTYLGIYQKKPLEPLKPLQTPQLTTKDLGSLTYTSKKAALTTGLENSSIVSQQSLQI